MIYLDYSANTPVNPKVLDEFCTAEREYIGNPNSQHIAGTSAAEVMEKTDESISELLCADGYEIIYTSGASESNNLAIKGIAHAAGHGHIISTVLEHESVRASLLFLEKEGYDVDCLEVKSDGKVNLDQLHSLMRDDTILVAVCAVDSELGTVQPIQQIAEIVHEYKDCALHVDATQAVGKINLTQFGNGKKKIVWRSTFVWC